MPHGILQHAPLHTPGALQTLRTIKQATAKLSTSMASAASTLRCRVPFTAALQVLLMLS